LAEIEGTLLLHDMIRQAVVVAREDSPGNQRLVAYLVLAQRSDGIISEARSRLQQKLPEYMVPSAFVVLDALPLTPSGKLDRRSLPVPSLGRAGPDTRSVAPRTRPEKELTQVWRELLGVEPIDIYDNFFELGGHSLLFTQLASRIREIFHVEMPLRILFNVPTVSEMIAAIAEKQIEQEDANQMAQMLDDLKQLSPEQVRMLLEAEGEFSLVDQEPSRGEVIRE
jgi:acyl carrier protein